MTPKESPASTGLAPETLGWLAQLVATLFFAAIFTAIGALAGSSAEWAVPVALFAGAGVGYVTTRLVTRARKRFSAGVESAPRA
jgi:hypothetical protein